MKIFLEIFKIGLKSSFQYRGGFLLSLVFDPLILMLFISLLEVVYSNSPDQIILGYSLTQMIWYFAATKFFYYLIWTATDRGLSDAVVNGEMALRLIRPLSILKWEFGKSLASKVSSFVFEFLPTLGVFTLLVFPDFLTFLSLVKYLCICLLSFVLFFLISFVIGTVSFFWQRNAALVNIKTIMINLLAGVAIPLEFYPNIIQKTIAYLPFQYLCYVPTQFLLNKPYTQDWGYFFEVIIYMLLWISFFYVMSVGFWNIAVKKYISVGG